MVLSGCNGNVKISSTEIAEVTAWNLDRTTAVDAYGSNQTSCHKKRVAGTQDYTGSFSAKADDGASGVVNGASVTLELHVDDTDLNYFECPVIITGISGYEVDIDDGTIISYEATFEANGALTLNGTVT